MPGFRRHTVAFTGGSGAWIGDPAGGQDNRLRRIAATLSSNSLDRAVLHFQKPCPVPGKADPQLFQPPLQGRADIKGPVRHRKHPVSTLRLQRHTQVLEKSHGVLRMKTGKRAVKELSITRDISQKALQPCVIRQVAPAFPGDIQLFPQPLIGFQQRHKGSPLRCGNRGHHPGGSAANYYYFLTHRPSFRTRRTRSKCSPAPQT